MKPIGTNMTTFMTRSNVRQISVSRFTGPSEKRNGESVTTATAIAR